MRLRFEQTPEAMSSKTTPIRLLVLQPSPFCNINCDYCYLPDRDSTKRLSKETFGRILLRIFDSGLVGERLDIVWHAGEPMALPLSYYQEIFRTIDETPIPKIRLRHSIQTNGMLIDDRWCEFIKANQVNIGLSIDGPAFLHDKHRKDRAGRGTHSSAMRGLECLRRNGVPFHVIAVVTRDSLDHADQIFSFFLEQGVQRVGFNIEELEGVHETTTVSNAVLEERARAFWTRIYELQERSRGAIRIRELDRATNCIAPHGPDAGTRLVNEQVLPFGIVSIDWQGNVSSFSPELLGIKSMHYGDFVFGSILKEDLQTIRRSEKFTRVVRDIEAGVKLCEQTCQYFALCGGGAPSNKYFENGTFVSTESMYCRTTIQMPADVVLAHMEKSLGLDKALPAIGG